MRGNARQECDLLGRHGRAEPLARVAEELQASASLGAEARLQRDESLHRFADDRVGLADDAGLGDRGVLHQRALDLERADQMAGGLDDVVGAPDEPEVAVGVALRQVAGQVKVAGEALR